MPELPAHKLSCDPVALEKCFLVADILADSYGEPYLEYGLVGLADLSKPFHMLATTLLPGQEVTSGSVYQSGFDVLRLRQEVALISKRLRVSLAPIAFIHRHPSACGMSAIDERLLHDVFVRQVSTVITLKEERHICPQTHDCVCAADVAPEAGSNSLTAEQRVVIQYSVAFSLIVNREREHSLDAAKTEWCPFCGRTRTETVPARLDLKANRSLSNAERARLRRVVELEVEAKIRLRSKHASTHGACV